MVVYVEQCVMSLDIETGIVRMHAQTWVHTLHTARVSYLRCSGSLLPDRHFVIIGGYKIHEFNCELTFLKGEPDETDRDILKDGIGVFELHKGAKLNCADFMGAWLYVADELYSEVWGQVANSNCISAMIELHVGPVARKNGMDEVVLWDRTKQEALFITEATIMFSKTLADFASPHVGLRPKNMLHYPKWHLKSPV